MRAAKWMGVPPWEVAEVSVAWREWALMADRIDQDVSDFKLEQQLKRMFG